ncbi:hypothetical protein BDV19DRAFT_392401 [Aspergillus venezuelensis]
MPSTYHPDHPPGYAEATAPGTNLTPTSSRSSFISTNTTSTMTTSNQISTPTSGSTPFLPRNPTKGHDTRFAMLVISPTDKIRFMRFPEPMTALASEVISTLWPRGIQRVQNYDESLEFKLKGNPFSYSQDDDKIAIRIVLMGILNAFAKEGWVVLPAGRVVRMGDYRSYGIGDSLTFQHTTPLSTSWMCISFDSDDLLHLINAPTELAEALISFFGERVLKCNKDFVSGNFEIKMRNTPWTKSSAKGGIQARVLVLELLQCLEEQGYTLATSLDVDDGSGGSCYRSQGEMWFCCR